MLKFGVVFIKVPSSGRIVKLSWNSAKALLPPSGALPDLRPGGVAAVFAAATVVAAVTVAAAAVAAVFAVVAVVAIVAEQVEIHEQRQRAIVGCYEIELLEGIADKPPLFE